jgi:hypothetical protein
MIVNNSIILGLSSSAPGVVRAELDVRGSINYDHPADFAATIGLVRGQALPWLVCGGGTAAGGSG